MSLMKRTLIQVGLSVVVGVTVGALVTTFGHSSDGVVVGTLVALGTYAWLLHRDGAFRSED